MKQYPIKTTTAAFAAFAALAISSNAATMVVQPTGLSVADLDPINGSGMNTPELIETGDPVPTTWPTIAANNSDNGIWRGGWIGDAATDTTGAIVDFELGDTYAVEGVYWWGSNRTNNRGTLRASFSVSTDDGATWTPVAAATDYLLIAPNAAAFAASAGEYIDFGGSIAGVTDVRVDNVLSSGYAGTINELRIVATVVPEPSSAALLGLGGLALIMRRRK